MTCMQSVYLHALDGISVQTSRASTWSQVSTAPLRCGGPEIPTCLNWYHGVPLQEPGEVSGDQHRVSVFRPKYECLSFHVGFWNLKWADLTIGCSGSAGCVHKLHWCNIQLLNNCTAQCSSSRPSPGLFHILDLHTERQRASSCMEPSTAWSFCLTGLQIEAEDQSHTFLHWCPPPPLFL